MNRFRQKIPSPGRWILPLFGWALVLLFSPGCASSFQRDYVAEDFEAQKGKVLAILPFRNLSGYPRAGEIVSDLMTTEFYSTNQFQIMKPQKVEKILAKEKFQRDKIKDMDYLKKIARKLGADWVCVGSVSEYQYKKSLGEEPVVGINARMISITDGRLLWASSHSAGGEYFWFSHDSLNRLAQEICYDMVAYLLD